MAGVRGIKNPMPKAGGKPTGMFSSRGKQKQDPIGGGFKPSLTGSNYRMDRKDPVKRNNRLG